MSDKPEDLVEELARLRALVLECSEFVTRKYNCRDVAESYLEMSLRAESEYIRKMSAR